MKEAFEKWYKEYFKTNENLLINNEEYHNDYVQSLWECWQAGYRTGVVDAKFILKG